MLIGQTVLNDMNKKIVEAGIVVNAVIEIDFTGISVNVVKPDGSTFQVTVDPDETVQTIVDQVSEKTQIGKTTFTLRKGSQTLVGIGLIRACEFAAGDFQQYQVDNCAKLYKGSLTG